MTLTIAFRRRKKINFLEFRSPPPRRIKTLVVLSFFIITLAEADDHCGQPAIPHYARVLVNGKSVSDAPRDQRYHRGTIAEVICDEGYELIGNSSIICSEQGSWESDQPSCALREIANQSSTVPEGDAAKDSVGHLPTEEDLRLSCSQTGEDDSPWWKVDLDTPHVVSAVKLTSRRCCGFQLRNLEIRVGNNVTHRQNPLCTRFPGPVDYGKTRVFRCSGGLSGRFVSIEMVGVTGSLSLCNVQVISPGVIDCQTPPDVRNGNVFLVNGTTTFDSIAEYRCAPGFTPQGPFAIQCTASGEWLGPVPVCVQPTKDDLMLFLKLGIGAVVLSLLLASGVRRNRKKITCQENSSESVDVSSFKRKPPDFCGTISQARHKRAGRPSYGDSAVGYVQLKRVQSICHLKGSITPEHRIRKKGYTVTRDIDEEKEEVLRAQCHDCAASQGGCKHAVALLMWCHRRSEDPSPTSVQCYWKKSRLASVAGSGQFLTAAEFSARKIKRTRNDERAACVNFLEDASKRAGENKDGSQIWITLEQPPASTTCSMSVYHLARTYVKHIQERGEGICFKGFSEFCSASMTPALCSQAERETLRQSNSAAWHNLRLLRITASRFHEAAHCKVDGSLVELLFGAQKVQDTQAMKRGRILESRVIGVVSERLGTKLQNSGLVLSQEYPLFGASPDAVGNDCVIEVKCPAKASTFKTYSTETGGPAPRYYAQIQLQMLFTGKDKGYFCVADPNFEENEQVSIVLVQFDDLFVKTKLVEALEFWENKIFPKLLRAVE